MVKKPQDRVEAVRPAIEKLGGKLLSGYLAFGKYDLIAITEMPNNVSAAAFSLAVAAGGAVSNLVTTPLMSTKDGIVTLSGKVDSGAERALAIELADNVRGVKSVRSKGLTI